MTYASVCDGIGAVHVAWRELGWRCAWTAEIETFPATVVEHHFPGVPNLGDILKITPEQLEQHGAIDLLVGGTPCQSFSVAGLRGGLDDARGNLALRFCQLAGALRPQFLLWENVPGVLSSGGGRDFGSILGAMGKLGYGFAYRVLDAQFFGLAQRRKRVFVVGYLGDWRRAAAVLFERACLRGDSPPSRETGARVTGTITSHAQGGGGLGTDFDCDGGLTPSLLANGDSHSSHRGHDGLVPAISPALKARDYKGPSSDGDGDGAPLIPCVTHSLRADGFDASEDGGTPLVPIAFAQNSRDEVREIGGNVAGAISAEPGMKQQTFVAMPILEAGKRCGVAASQRDGTGIGSAGDPMFTLQSGAQHAVAFQTRIARNGRGQPKEIADALTSCEGGTHADSKPHVAGAFGVRRLLPSECEILQGFPKNYTNIAFRGKPASDSARYRALGNSMAVPVISWLGRRIQAVSELEATP